MNPELKAFCETYFICWEEAMTGLPVERAALLYHNGKSDDGAKWTDFQRPNAQ